MQALRRGGLAALLLLFAVCPPARAFHTMGGALVGTEHATTSPSDWLKTSGQATFAHWDLREFDNGGATCQIPWSAKDGTPDVPGNDEFTAIQSAFDVWQAVEPAIIQFKKVALPAGAMAPGNLDNNNVLGFIKTPLGGATIALTTSWITSAGRITEADIAFDDTAYVWQNVGHNAVMHGHPDVWTVALHEIGHFIGLAHADTSGNGNPPGPVMNPSLFLNDDVWLVGAGLQSCGSNVGANTAYIGAGPDTVIETSFNNCNANGDDGSDGVTIDAGFDGIADSDPASSPDFSNHVLSPDDEDGINFLYCPDLGDAPDECVAGSPGSFPTLVRRGPGRTLNGIRLVAIVPHPGAEHILGRKPVDLTRNFTYEWLGQAKDSNVDADCEAHIVNLDKLDDGVTLNPNPPVPGKPLQITNWIWYGNDNDGNHHDYQAHPLFVNTWLDLDQNCAWATPGERVVHGLRKPSGPGVGPANEVHQITVDSTITLPKAFPKADQPMWLRSRLDWGEDTGDQFNVDGTLSHEQGAAQFGEVEDYDIKAMNPIRQQAPQNSRPSSQSGMGMVFPGNVTAGLSFAARVTTGDCALDQGSPPAMAYDPLRDETTITFISANPVNPGECFHSGRDHPADSPAYVLRSFWTPEAGAPGVDDWVPTTNSVVLAGSDPGGGLLPHVVVGTTNVEVGGVIAGSSAAGNWLDSMFVDVTARVSPAIISLPQLNLCDPGLQGLAATHVGGSWIHPDRPFEFDFAGLSPSQTLILEIHSSWSLNLNTNMELVELRNPLAEVVADANAPAWPTALSLRNYPNPQRRTSTIEFTLPRAAEVELSIHDLRGARIRLLAPAREWSAGDHAIVWDGADSRGRPVEPGVYFFVLRVGEQRSTSKAVMLR